MKLCNKKTNKQKKVKKSLQKCDSYLYSLKAAGNSNDYLANEMLSLVITLKIFILNHNADALDFERAIGRYDPDVVGHLNALDRRRLDNFHYINTLENLKLHMVKNRNRKKKRWQCSSCRHHHHHHRRRSRSSDSSNNTVYALSLSFLLSTTYFRFLYI